MDDLLSSNILKYKTFILLISVAVSAFVLLSLPEKASAAYDGSRLIDNSVFLDANSMNASDIQSFFVERGAGLASRNFVLNCYGPTSKERQLYTSAGAPCDQSIPASQIIYYASQIYGVNPKVVLATMQKEQGVANTPNPTDWQINQAMGYGCPTTGNCGGASTFPYQIDSGVWALRHHYERASGNLSWWSQGTSWTCGGSNQSLYTPNLYPGSSTTFKDTNGVAYRTITISNAATAAFYCYTPHTYNNHRNGVPQQFVPAGTLCYPYAPHVEFGSTGLCYTGSYNFVYWYERWFGASTTNARVHIRPIDPITDNTGKAATVQVELNQPISSPVAISFRINNENLANFASSPYLIIQPENWNRPEKNTVVLRGNSVSQNGMIRYALETTAITTSDQQFQLLSGKDIDDVNMTHSANGQNEVYRLFNPVTGLHAFTTITSERSALLANGYTDEGVSFYYCQSGEIPIYQFKRTSNSSSRRLAPQTGQITNNTIAGGYSYDFPLISSSRGAQTAVFALGSGINTFYTTSVAERALAIDTYGYIDLGIAFYSCNPNTKAIYRLFSSTINDHLYTASSVERDIAAANGYVREGVGFYGCNGVSNIIAMNRLYSASYTKHFYTTIDAEKTFAQSNGYMVENGGFNLCSNGTGSKIYRLYNPALKKHFYTPSTFERDALMGAGYLSEGEQ